MKNNKLSLVIPIYNEYTRLVSGLTQALTYLKKQPYRWELILVDDGSEVPVSALVAQAQKRGLLRFKLEKLPVRVIRLEHNQGKGAAIRAGVAKASGDYIVFSDIDFSVPITFVKSMLLKLADYPIVIASRRMRDATIVVHQGFLREQAGRVFTWLSNFICETAVVDATCGFKGFQAKTAKKLFGLSKINRWVFDTEILFIARKQGIPVYQMPVAWEDKKGSKVKLADTLIALVDLFRIRWHSVTGVYRYGRN